MGEREEYKPLYRQFEVAVATLGATRHPLCQRDVHGAMSVVSGYSSPTGALQRCHTLNCDIIELAKVPSRKANQSTLDY